MADRVKGITIALGADTTGLSKALKDVDKNIKDTKSDLKDVERLLKLDPTNTELLEQKQRLLGQSVEDTKEKLSLLQEAEEKMRAEMENATEVTRDQQAAYDNLQREIYSTTDYLQKDEQALRDTAKAMEDAAAKADTFSSKLGKVQDAAGKISSKTRGVSMAAGGALGGIVGGALKAAATADDLNTLAQQTGLSTDALQEMKYASDLIDVSFDTFASSSIKMTKTLGSNEDAFARLGVATRDASGEYLKTEEIYFNAVNALGQIENETERDIAAQELFGKSSAELAGLIDDGGAAFRQYAQEAHDMDAVLSGETLDSMQAVNDTVDHLKAVMTAELFAAAAPALEVLAPVIEDIAAALGKVFEFIGGLSTTQIEVGIAILGIVAAISPVAGLISGIAGSIKTITPIIKTLNTVLATNPLLLIIGLIVLITTLIITNWDTIEPILEKFKEKFLAVLEKVKDAFIQFKDKIAEIFGIVKEKIQTGVDTIKNLLSGFRDSFIKIFEGIKNGIKTPINAIIGFLNTVIDGVNALINNPLTSAVAGVFGANAPRLPKIPLLANGGTLTSGSAIVGEAGPELLTLAHGAAQVTPIVNMDTSGIERAISGINTGGGAPINLQLNIDGKAFARATYNAQAYEATRRGGRLVTV